MPEHTRGADLLTRYHCRSVLLPAAGGFFIWTSIAKLLATDGVSSGPWLLAEVLDRQQAFVGLAAIVVAWGVILAECLIGVGLLIPKTSKLCAAFATVLLAAMSVYVAHTFRTQQLFECACFGAITHEEHWRVILRNAAICAALLFGVFGPRTGRKARGAHTHSALKDTKNATA